MNSEIDLYLSRVSRGLEKIPETERKDIIDEINSHINEAIASQENVASVLHRLGDPAKLANSYLSSYSLKTNSINFSYILNNLAFYSSVALSGMFVIPFLGIMIYVLKFVAALIVAIAIINQTGLTNIPFNIGFMPVYGISQIFVAIVSGIIFLLLSNACRSGLKKYLSVVTEKYRENKYKQ